MDAKNDAGAFDMAVTNQSKHAARECRADPMPDLFHRLAENVQDASGEEAAEILSEIGDLSDDDLAIVSTKRFAVRAETGGGALTRK